MISLIVALQLASQMHVPATTLVPPDDLFWTIDSSDATTGAFAATNHFLSVQARLRAVDRACVIWARNGGVGKQCRAESAVNTGGSVRHPNDSYNQFHFFDDNRGDACTSNSQCVSGVCGGLDAGICDGTNFAGEMWCHLAPWPVYPFVAQCDIYLEQDQAFVTYSRSVANDLCDTGAGCLGGETWNNPAGRSGSAFSAVYQSVTLHEIGHELGFLHTRVDGTFNDCTPLTYDCGIMSQGPERVSWWPNIDDITAMRSRWNENVRSVQLSLASPSQSGVLPGPSWSTLGSVTSGLSPRLSCKPETSTSENCVVSTVPVTGGTVLWGGPTFHLLNVTSTGATVASTLSSTVISDVPVDVAYGTGGRFLGVGRRPANAGGASHRLVVYRGDSVANTLTVTSFANQDCSNGQVTGADANDTSITIRTHTEPRVSWHDTQGVFVVSSVSTDGMIQITTLDVTGQCIDTAFIDQRTLTPVEVACDTHLPGGSAYCNVYTTPHATRSDFELGRIDSFTITIGTAGNLLDTETFSAPAGFTGDLISVVAEQLTGVFAPLIGDVLTYGNGRSTSQYPQAAWLMSADRFRDVGSNPGQWLFANEASISGILSSGTYSMTDNQSNVSSWDWNESAQRIVAVRLGVEQ